MSDDKIFAEIANAGNLTNYAPAAKEGEHILALLECEQRQTLKYGRLFSFEFSVVSSTSHPKGARVGEGFFVDKAGFEGEYAKKRILAIAAAIVEGLGGSADNLALCQQTLSEMFSDKQPWRGAQVRCETTAKVAKKSGKPFNNNMYLPVKQDAASIQAIRAELEGGMQATAPAPKPAILPAPAGTGSLLK